MNVALWVTQALLALLMTATGLLKLLTPKEKLVTRMKWAVPGPAGRIKALGLAEVLGAVGLVAPWATGLMPWLTPLAAGCLSILMVGAARTHLALKEPVWLALVPLVLLVFTAVGRSGLLG